MTSIIVPAYNEEVRISETVAALVALDGVDEVLVVNDGSSDDTSAVAARSGARVLDMPRNLGKAAALAEGIRACRGEIIAMVDADLGATAAQAGLLIAPVTRGEADMTIAAFAGQRGAGAGFGLVVRLARWGIQRATGITMTSPLSGQRAMRRPVWDALQTADGFGVEVALTIDAARAGHRVLEVPVTMTHRATGRDLAGFRHRGRQFVAVARELWRRRRCLL
ncbi:MAG: glycosyltransferase family 2 protein [Armatimonadetes bacterium]|nr:glycosyltransferase family 2 protein [Armatimonadota bacterium]